VLSGGHPARQDAQGLPRVRHQRLTGRGQRDAPRRALEELHAEARLELAHLGRERLLGEVQPLRGTSEAELLGHHDVRAQQSGVEIHHAASVDPQRQAVGRRGC
jgi:hypothetical protein